MLNVHVGFVASDVNAAAGRPNAVAHSSSRSSATRRIAEV